MQYIATQDLEERARDGDFTLARKVVRLGWLWMSNHTAGGGWEIIGFEEKVSTRPGTPTE